MKRSVLVDLGHGLAQLWTSAKVIMSQKCKNLFDEGNHEMLLVEVPGGERIWVSHWREVEGI